LDRRSSATREEEDLSDHLKIPPYVFLILATLFWAGNFTFGRMLSEALPPFGINLIRWIIACVVLVPLTLAREGRLARPPLGLWPALITMSVAGIILFQSLVYLSLRFTTSTNAALIAATTPVMTLLIAAAIRTDRLTVRHPHRPADGAPRGGSAPERGWGGVGGLPTLARRAAGVVD
jgi:hypothetical protein